MSAHSLAILALVRVEWSGTNLFHQRCCPECRIPLKGKGMVDPGYHFRHCILDQSLRTQADLQTPQERENLRQELFPPTERKRR